MINKKGREEEGQFHLSCARRRSSRRENRYLGAHLTYIKQANIQYCELRNKYICLRHKNPNIQGCLKKTKHGKRISRLLVEGWWSDSITYLESPSNITKESWRCAASFRAKRGSRDDWAKITSPISFLPIAVAIEKSGLMAMSIYLHPS